MAQVISYESLDRRTDATVGRSHRPLPPARSASGISPLSGAARGGAASSLEAFWANDALNTETSPNVAVIVMVGTTPHDEDAIALELRREGLQILSKPAVHGRRLTDGITGGDGQVSGGKFADRLLGILDRRLPGSLHATALTIARPALDEPSARDRRNATLSFGRLSIDFRRREVVVDHHEVLLSKTEFGLLFLLAEQAGRVFTRRELVSAGTQSEYPVTERSIDVHIAAIRRKLGPASEHVQTVRGVGYRFHESPRPVRGENADS